MDMHTAINGVKRVNPRRPFTITADGLKRIALGEVATENGVAAMLTAQAHHQAKPLRVQQTASKTLLAVAHSDRGALDEHARQVVVAAALLADAATEVVVLVFGELTDECAAYGADRVIVLPQLGSHIFAPEAELSALRMLIARLQPQHIFMADSATGTASADLGRRLGAMGATEDFSIATHVVEINATGIATHRQQASVMARATLPRIVLLAIDTVDIRLPFVGRGEPDTELAAMLMQTTVLASSYSDLGIKTLAASQMALDEADFILSAGNGVNDVAIFNTLASELDAAVGASRVAVDDGKFTRDKQIGATGKTVSASAYIAFGISGAVQHLQGIKDCRHVIAINLDASAPMIKRADLSIIADTQEVMQALLVEVNQAKQAKQTEVA